MKIKFHQKAVEIYNSKIQDLLLQLKPETKRKSGAKGLRSAKELYSEEISSDKIIDLEKVAVTNGFGSKLGRFFKTDKGSIGLSNSAYQEFETLVEDLSKKKEIGEYLSIENISNIIFQFFKEKYIGKLNQNHQFVDYFVEQSEATIKKRKISVPIENLQIEVSFKIGNITFDFFTKEFFNTLEDYLLKRKRQDEIKGFNNLRKKYQGIVFASFEIEADFDKSIQIALNEVEKALMILRLFSPTVFIPQISNFTGIMGRVNVPSHHAFIFEEEFPIISNSIDIDTQIDWPIDKRLLHIYKHGLDAGGKLIMKKKPSEIELLLLNSISLFTKGIIFNSFQDRIVYILASLETLLLKNSSEPIQSSVGLRAAFLYSPDPEERKRVVDFIKKCYILRSKYIHHGIQEDNYDLLKELQIIIWTVLNNVLINISNYKKQEDLLKFVENLVYQ